MVINMEDRIKEYMPDEELEQLIQEVEENGMLSVPSYMKKEIMEQIHQVHKQEAHKDIQRKLSLWLYSMEVGVVAAAAVLLLFLIPVDRGDNGNIDRWAGREQETVSAMSKLHEKSNDICGQVFQITNQLVAWEEN